MFAPNILLPKQYPISNWPTLYPMLRCKFSLFHICTFTHIASLKHTTSNKLTNVDVSCHFGLCSKSHLKFSPYFHLNGVRVSQYNFFKTLLARSNFCNFPLDLKHYIGGGGQFYILYKKIKKKTCHDFRYRCMFFRARLNL